MQAGAHRDISDTVDITRAFTVAGVATSDLPQCSGFLFFWFGRLSKYATKTFDLFVLFVAFAATFVYHHKK
jgi:hypothetical protein